jgi:hypothetical protein
MVAARFASSQLWVNLQIKPVLILYNTPSDTLIEIMKTRTLSYYSDFKMLSPRIRLVDNRAHSRFASRSKGRIKISMNSHTHPVNKISATSCGCPDPDQNGHHGSSIAVSNGRSLAVQETDMYTKTRHECIRAGSGAASLQLTVLVNMSVSWTKPSHMALGVAEIGTAI